MILLTAEVLELKANPNRKARGLVIEAELDKGKGPVATILVQKGTLHVGDYIAAGACSGKVRAMMDDKGRRVKEAGPSTPVEILGLSDVPNAGEILVQTDNDKEARELRSRPSWQRARRTCLRRQKRRCPWMICSTRFRQGNCKRTGTRCQSRCTGICRGSKTESCQALQRGSCRTSVIHGGVGAINESDVMLATASSAIIIGFNVRPDANAKSMAERERRRHPSVPCHLPGN